MKFMHVTKGDDILDHEKTCREIETRRGFNHVAWLPS
jgi:hypothetical protein